MIHIRDNNNPAGTLCGEWHKGDTITEETEYIDFEKRPEFAGMTTEEFEAATHDICDDCYNFSTGYGQI